MKITITVHPNSKNPRIEQDFMKNLAIYVNASAKEGQANRAVIDALARFYKTNKSKVVLLKGEKSKHKVFLIS